MRTRMSPIRKSQLPRTLREASVAFKGKAVRPSGRLDSDMRLIHWFNRVYYARPTRRLVLRYVVLGSTLSILPFVLSLFLTPRMQAQSLLCATPGKDGTGGTLTGIVNTYYPGSATANAAATQITLGAATGASNAISSGDLLIVIQMQDASINSNN